MAAISDLVTTGSTAPPGAVPGDAALAAIVAPVAGAAAGQLYVAGVRLAGQGGLTPEVLRGALTVLATCLPDVTGCSVGGPESGVERMKIRAVADFYYGIERMGQAGTVNPALDSLAITRGYEFGRAQPSQSSTVVSRLHTI